MKNFITTDSQNLIVGGGATGLSVARFLKKTGLRYSVYDTRDDMKIARAIHELDADVRVTLGEYDDALFNCVTRIILSPGVSRNEQVVLEAIEREIPIIGDIKLFLEHCKAPVVGITGTNGKSTVTTLTGLVAQEAGLNVAVGGNLGIPALDLLNDDVELYVLEISSFQLESTNDARLDVAVNLNVSQDHLDRHGSLMNYFQAKQKIFHGAKVAIYNLHDPLTQPPVVHNVKRFGFGINSKTEKSEIQICIDQETGCVVQDGEKILDCSAVKLKGSHNLENILAVCAISSALEIGFDAFKKAVSVFPGLEHRCETVSEINGVTFINDSKATNVGAVISAIEGLSGMFGQTHLIAGGVAKGQNFAPLAEVIQTYEVAVTLFGQDAQLIFDSLDPSADKTVVNSLSEAVERSVNNAQSGDLVLFSPACASFDMFNNYEERGRAFKAFVQEVAA